MALLDEARSNAGQGNVGASGTPVVEESTEKVNYQAKKREQAYQDALLLQKALKRGNVTLSPEETEALARLTRAPGTGRGPGNFGKPVIYQLFGDNPKVGTSITALDVFQKTGKGYQEMNQLVKKWGEKGNVVTFNPDNKTFTLKEIGILPQVGAPSKA
jgi:hypothetical protein